MSVKLYEADVYQRHFSSFVTTVKQDDKGMCHVALDATAFYPEGGGQPSDRGFLGDRRVSHVYEKAGDIWHVVDGPVVVNERVEGKIDWPRRFHFMQQHTGQHIISAIFETLCGAETSSVHFGEALSTIDLSLPVTGAQIEEAEQRCNAVIYADIAVEISCPDPASVPESMRRKVPDTDEALRIVKVGDVDLIPCCGTHCTRTGEIGIIKLFRSESYKGGVRLTFACGGAALHKLSQAWRDIQGMQRTLSVADSELAARVEKLQGDYLALEKAHKALESKLYALEAERLLSGALQVGTYKLLVHSAGEADREGLKNLFFHLTQQEDAVVVLGGVTGEGAVLMLGAHRGERVLDLRPLFGECLAMIDGKGGGGPQSCQGMGGNTDGLAGALEYARSALTDQLGAS